MYLSRCFSSLVSLFGKHILHLIIPREQNFRNKLLWEDEHLPTLGIPSCP